MFQIEHFRKFFGGMFSYCYRISGHNLCPNRQVGPPVFYNPIENDKCIVKNIKGLFFQYGHIRKRDREIHKGASPSLGS